MRAKLRKGLATAAFFNEVVVFLDAYQRGVKEYKEQQNQSTTATTNNASKPQPPVSRP